MTDEKEKIRSNSFLNGAVLKKVFCRNAFLHE